MGGNSVRIDPEMLFNMFGGAAGGSGHFSFGGGPRGGDPFGGHGARGGFPFQGM